MDIDISLDYGLTLLAALLIGTGFVLQQHAASREPDSRFLRFRLLTDLLRTPGWLAGIGCMVGGQVLAAWSIGHLALGFVEPLLTMNLVFALVIAVPLVKASLKVWEILGAVVLIAGVSLLSAARSAKPVGLSFGSVSHWPAAAVIAAIAFIVVHAGLRRQGRRRAILTATGAGLIFGVQDALTRQTLEILQSSGISALFTTWAPYALVGAGAIGIWLMQSAFNAGPLNVSLPAIAAGEPLVGILLGVIVFGDRIQVTPGMLAMQAGGIAALIVGVILVGRAPALSQLRTWTPPYGLPNPIPGKHPREEDEAPSALPPERPHQPQPSQQSQPLQPPQPPQPPPHQPQPPPHQPQLSQPLQPPQPPQSANGKAPHGPGGNPAVPDAGDAGDPAGPRAVGDEQERHPGGETAWPSPSDRRGI